MSISGHNLLKLMAFTDCFDSVSERISMAVQRSPRGRILVELTEYVPKL